MAGMAQVIEHLFMPRAAWARILSFMLSASYFAFCIAGITGTHYHTQLLLVEMGGLTNILLRLPSKHYRPDLFLPRTRITGMRHWYMTYPEYF
jgi:hypothetical protein